MKWEVLSQTGQRVMKGSGTNIALVDLAPGVYFLATQQQQEVIRTKFIKQ
jgi:hypothetical protein